MALIGICAGGPHILSDLLSPKHLPTVVTVYIVSYNFYRQVFKRALFRFQNN